MKTFKTILCVGMILFLVFAPKPLTAAAQEHFIDARFVRKEPEYRGTITLYHIARQRPYFGSLSNWLQKRADEYEKKHRGSSIAVESMNEAEFAERLEHGRRADAYSFFSGSVYRDLLADIKAPNVSFKDGIFLTDLCIPYCYTGYGKLIRNQTENEPHRYYATDILAAYLNGGADTAEERKADELYLDLRRAGDLMRYVDGFANAELQPIDNFTDAVCWIGIDRDTDEKKRAVIESFIEWMLDVKPQQKLNSLGLLSVRSDIRDTVPESVLKDVFKTYETVETVDPFGWYTEYDALIEDAGLARSGDTDAAIRFAKRLQELKR